MCVCAFFIIKHTINKALFIGFCEHSAYPPHTKTQNTIQKKKQKTNKNEAKKKKPNRYN